MALIGLLIAGLGASGAIAAAGTPSRNGPPTTIPGSPGDDCSRGNSGSECRPDPSENGQDCDDHGKARGNEDHCQQAEPTTTASSTSTTSTATTTTNTATTSGTTTTTPQTATTTPPTSTATTPDSTTPQAPASTGAPGESTTTTAATARPATTTGSVAGSESDAPVTKPELEKELAKQVERVRSGEVTVARNRRGELPFTGFPAWALALFGSLMVATGLGLRKVPS